MSTDRKDEVLSLDARDDLLAIAAMWPALVGRLTPGGGNAQTGVVSSSGSAPLPIDVAVSDLMREIEDAARFYGRVLMDETTWTPTTSAMPVLLIEVARRHGHFTAGDERTALDFMDTAHELRERVRKTLVRPTPAVYVGPCRTTECIGELYVGDGKTAGTCRVCGTGFTLAEQRAWIGTQMEARLMTVTEIWRALGVLGTPVPVQTIHSWAARGALGDGDDGLYRLSDAVALVERRMTRVSAA